MSYRYLPGPLPGPLGRTTWYPWESFVVAAESGAAYTPPPPEDAPEEASPGAPEQAPEPPPPSFFTGAGSFFQRYKAFLIAGGLLAGYVWWRGRKR